MAKLIHPPNAITSQHTHAALQRVRNSKELGPGLVPILSIAINLAGADLGTVQRFNESSDSLTIVASSGVSEEALSFFGTVRRNTYTTCAAALTRRMRVFVEDVSTIQESLSSTAMCKVGVNSSGLTIVMAP